MSDDHDTATLIVTYPRDRGQVVLRGEGPVLDWYRDRAPDAVDGDVSTFVVPLPEGETQVKVVRGDGRWMVGRNLVVGRGDRLELFPSFEQERGVLSGPRTIEVPGGEPLIVRTMLPPSYPEQTARRYPVLYAQDGQSIWSDGHDPFGVWGLDRVLDDLWDLGALEELIVVAIDTSHRRLDRLGPVPDPTHGGGQAAAHLAALVDTLKPHIDRELRTRTDRASTALLGASMGGLFSFWAAWTRPDLFGTAICLSSSFWWAERWLIKQVKQGVCPAPRPWLYLDSGAAASGFEADASTRDGVHHTRAMYRALLGLCYSADDDVHLLAFPGHRHDVESWAARVAVPLQLAFPRIA